MRIRLIGFFIWWSISVGCVISSLVLLIGIFNYGHIVVYEPNMLILMIEIVWTLIGATILSIELIPLLKMYAE